MSKRTLRKVRFQEEEKEPKCQECEMSHSQFFKCPHYKGNKKRAQKLCEKLKEKLGDPELKFTKESDLLSFKPEHVFTIEGFVDKKIVSPFSGKLVKSDQWKQILSALKQYRGLTWTSPGVQEALFIQFGKEGVLQNKKLFIDKLNQMLKHTRHGGGESVPHNNHLDQIMNEIRDQEELGDTPEEKVINIVEMVKDVSFQVQANKALYDEKMEFINEDLEGFKQSIHGKYGLYTIHSTFKDRMINTTDDLRESTTNLNKGQIEMSISLKNLEARHEDLSTRHDAFVRKAQEMSDAFEEFKKNSNKAFERAAKAKSSARFVKKCFDNFMRVDRQREREMNAMKRKLQLLEQKVFCFENGFDMKSFVNELVDSVAGETPYIFTGEVADALD